jgi:hypothetical protein
LPPRSSEEKLKAAGEIREVVQRYLRASPEKARSQLPSDWALMLPLEVGAAEADHDGDVRLGVWRFHLEGDQARLDFYPPGSVNAHHRLWFRIQLTRKSGGWEIVPPGVSFVRAWSRDR